MTFAKFLASPPSSLCTNFRRIPSTHIPYVITKLAMHEYSTMNGPSLNAYSCLKHACHPSSSSDPDHQLPSQSRSPCLPPIHDCIPSLPSYLCIGRGSDHQNLAHRDPGDILRSSPCQDPPQFCVIQDDPKAPFADHVHMSEHR